MKMLAERRDERIVERLIDAILTDRADPSLYRLLAQAQHEVGATNPYSSSDEYRQPDQIDAALESFLSRWVAVEAGLTRVLSNRLPRLPRPGRSIFRPEVLKMLGILDEHQINQVLELRHTRNNLVHHFEVPTVEELTHATEVMDRLLYSLQQADHDAKLVIESILRRTSA
jgi:hypothetical protein